MLGKIFGKWDVRCMMKAITGRETAVPVRYLRYLWTVCQSVKPRFPTVCIVIKAERGYII